MSSLSYRWEVVKRNQYASEYENRLPACCVETKHECDELDSYVAIITGEDCCITDH